jgi:NAD(P)-dependent dehydrogenase (short-subunit alcohol dehydrogenase family)
MTNDRNAASGGGSPAWLITGCSSGLGRALAQRVLERGQRAVITARDPATLADLAARFPAAAVPVALDVRNEAQRNAAVTRALEAFGGIDVLVNNAGHGYSAAVEEGEDAPVRAMFETNFFALAALTRAVLPHMRARGRGHIVNISSIGGIVGNPATGYYSATKFAVEGLSEALAKEVEPLGIRVTLIEPGPFRTEFQGRSMTTTARTIEAYASTAGARRAQLRANSGRQAGDPARAADAIIRVVESPTPPLHLVLGKVGVERVREKLSSLMRSMDEWERVSLGADFPEPGA